MALKKDLVFEQGKTFRLVVRWENEKLVYKPITGITQAAPATITCVGHGVPDGWNVAITSVKGMTQINAANTPPKDKDYVQATALTADTIELNSVNAASYSTYTANSGYVQYYEPHSLALAMFRMKIKDKVGGTVLLDSTLVTPEITLTSNNTDKTITIEIDALTTEAVTWTKGVYDLEADEAGVVTALLTGTVTVTKEVTTTT